MSNYNMHIDDLINTAEGSGSQSKISDGMYGAVVIGYAVTKSEFHDKETGTIKESIGAKLIMQVKDDEGNPAIVSTTAMKASLHEKASLRAVLASWMKKSDVKGIVDELVKCGIITDNTFSWEGFIGRKPALMINMVAGKKDANKLYPQIKGIVPCKKDMVIDAVVGEVPEFFIKDALEYKLMDGFTIKKSKKKETNHMETQPQQEISTEIEDKELPF